MIQDCAGIHTLSTYPELSLGRTTQMWPEIYYGEEEYYSCYDSRLYFLCRAELLCREADACLHLHRFCIQLFSFVLFWLFYLNNGVFASAMIDYVCFCVVWNFYQRCHSFPSLTLRALLSAPPTPSLIGWEPGPSILYLICLALAPPIIRKLQSVGPFELQQIWSVCLCAIECLCVEYWVSILEEVWRLFWT